MKNNSWLSSFLFVIILFIIVAAIYLMFFHSDHKIENIDLYIDAPDVVFVGENNFIDVKINSENQVFVIYKNGYIASDKISYYGTNFKVPFVAKKAGDEEVEVKVGDISKNLKIFICDKINAKNGTISLIVGSSYNLNFKLNKTCLSQYTFDVENKSIATYNDGVIKGNKIGTTNLNISRGNEKYTYKIQVKAKELKFATTNSSMNVGASKKINLTGVDGTLKCESDNPKVATAEVSVNACLIKAVGPGETTITALSGGKKATTKVKITQPVISVAFKNTSYSVPAGSTINAPVTITPTNASNKAFSCSSEDTSIATVSVNGSNCVVKGVKIGKTRIIVTASGKNASADIVVTNPAKIVTIRVATWNLARYSKPSIWVEKQAKFFKSKNVDIGAFQEVKNKSGSMTTPLNVYKSVTGYNYAYYDLPAGNAIITKYKIKSVSRKPLTSCKESRGLLKIIVNINGIDISVYDTHFSYQSECLKIHANNFANLIKSDTNPQIVMGDFNGAGSALINALGSDYKIIAHDTIRNIYADSVIIKAKDKTGKVRLKGVSFETVKTAGTYTDHNMVLASIQVIN